MQIQATIIGFTDMRECIALVNGENILIDPFMTCAWDWEYKDNILGTWLFEGFWNDDCFLPDKVIQIQ